MRRAAGGRAWPAALADEAWAVRLSDLRAKRAGPTLLGAGWLLRNERLAAFAEGVAQLVQRVGLPIYTYAHLARQVGSVAAFFPADERRTFGYLLDLSLTKRLMDLGLGLGGRPYGLGAWNTLYLSGALSGSTELAEVLSKGRAPIELAELRQRKQRLDPHDILNPGKVYHTPPRLPAPLFRLGTEGLFRLRALT